MSGLFLAGDSTFSSLAVGSILVVAVAVLGSLTVLPAVLTLLGTRVNALSPRFLTIKARDYSFRRFAADAIASRR